MILPPLPVPCAECGCKFVPKPKGHNARYCSDKCKRRSQRKRLLLANPVQLKAARKRSYAQTKAHHDRYAKHTANGRTTVAKNRAWLAAYKLEKGCADCGYRAHSAALQLDHEGSKSVSISDARSSIIRLLAEIENGKCVVRCANCHAVKTWERKQKSEK